MAQMLSTFSKVEQSRFEAFQRAKFAPHVISDWVAACLSHRFELTEPRPLADLVAAGRQAPEITLVVSVLAKIYAQRIVQTAVQLRGNSTTSETSPLTAAQLRQAFHERQRQGLDPGFFLQPASERPEAAMTKHQSKAYEQQRLAALEAQDKYDKWVKEQQLQKDNEESGDQGDGNNEMEVDNSPEKK